MDMQHEEVVTMGMDDNGSSFDETLCERETESVSLVMMLHLKLLICQRIMVHTSLTMLQKIQTQTHHQTVVMQRTSYPCKTLILR